MTARPPYSVIVFLLLILPTGAEKSEVEATATHLRRGKGSRRGLQFGFDFGSDFDFGFDNDFNLLPGVELPSEYCWVPYTTCAADNCAVVSPLGADEFDIDQFMEKSWFVQKQQVNPYQSKKELFCVVATYSKRSDGYIQVENNGRRGGVDGPATGADGGSILSELCAKQVGGGSLQVAPCIFQLAFSAAAGAYWVLAVDEVDYSWAIVSGGPPDQVRETVNGQTLCTTKEGSSVLDTNGSGLWLFTRDQVAPLVTVAIMEEKLKEMGIYTGDLMPVFQHGCTYPQTIKT